MYGKADTFLLMPFHCVCCALYFVTWCGETVGEKGKMGWKCRHNMTDVARYVCCLIITNDRSVKIK